MPSMGLILLFGGAVGTMLLLYAALSGPATSKATARRLESLRERHSRSSDLVAQAHMRRIFAQRASRSDSFAKRFIPNPALLQMRLTQTFAELLSQTVDYASAEGGAEQASPKRGGSLLGKLNFKSFSKKPKEASSQAA